jgi:hypothetical protein
MKCYLCLKEIRPGEETKDHIPPKNLFPKPRPSNLHTLNCCFTCNNNFSFDEEFFRDNIVPLSDLYNNSDAINIWENVIRSHNRNVPRRIEMLSRVSIDENTGLPILKIKKDKLEKISLKIAKGLFNIHTNKFIDSSYKIGFYIQPNNFSLEFLEKSQYKNRWGESFGYAGVVSDTESIWWLLFYKEILLVVSFSRKDTARERLI